MALTEAKRKANDKYIKGHYTQVKLSMPNDEADTLSNYCEKYGLTKAGFIRTAIKEKMERDHEKNEAELLAKDVNHSVHS